MEDQGWLAALSNITITDDGETVPLSLGMFLRFLVFFVPMAWAIYSPLTAWLLEQPKKSAWVAWSIVGGLVAFGASLGLYGMNGGFMALFAAVVLGFPLWIVGALGRVAFLWKNDREPPARTSAAFDWKGQGEKVRQKANQTAAGVGRAKTAAGDAFKERKEKKQEQKRRENAEGENAWADDFVHEEPRTNERTGPPPGAQVTWDAPPPPTFYDVLGCRPDANQETIKAARNAKAVEFNPDRPDAPMDAQERMKEVHAAYAVLSDPAKRREYNEQLRRAGRI